MRVAMLVMSAALVAACAPVRSVTLRVDDAAGAPAAGAHVRAVRMRSGPVPLPLRGDAIAELLSDGKTVDGAITDAQGRATLRLTSGFNHLVEVGAAPLDPRTPDAEPARAAFVLDPDGRSVAPAGTVAGARVRPPPSLRVTVIP